ncbi:hypothetical protein LCGC14_3046050, partial [marine sediment metagenome]
MKEDEAMPVYTIGIAAEFLGVCSATLRLWEKKGIVKPARIGKNRFYSKYDIDRLECIKHLLHEMRINIAGVKEILDSKFCWEVKNCSEKMRKDCLVY